MKSWSKSTNGFQSSSKKFQSMRSFVCKYATIHINTSHIPQSSLRDARVNVSSLLNFQNSNIETFSYPLNFAFGLTLIQRSWILKSHQDPASLSELVDSTDRLAVALEQIFAALNGRPFFTRLFGDLEGIKLSRQGTISLLTLLVNDDRNADRVYLFDIHKLGSAAFAFLAKVSKNCAGQALQTLKQILESTLVLKVFYDVRNDWDALFSHFGIRMRNVEDIQLIEDASCDGSSYGRNICMALPNASKRTRRSRERRRENGKLSKTKLSSYLLLRKVVVMESSTSAR